MQCRGRAACESDPRKSVASRAAGQFLFAQALALLGEGVELLPIVLKVEENVLAVRIQSGSEGSGKL